MRELKYLSPTAIDDFGESGDMIKRTEFYLKRLADHRPPRLPQTQPMSVGAAFDAFVKNYLHVKLYGNSGKIVTHKIKQMDGTDTEIKGPEFSLDLLFQVQVEPQNRKIAILDGARCLELYRSCGAMSDLLIEMQMAQGNVMFEITVEANISHECMICDVPLLGKPDMSFVFEFNGRIYRVIFDWKVNGYYSKSMKSPEKGYLKCRDAWDHTICPPSRGGSIVQHKDVIIRRIGNMAINGALPFEQVNKKFARQLTIYGWVMGAPVGSNQIMGIEQLCGKPWPGPNGPLLRIASHRGMVSEKYQYELALRISEIWTSIQSGHIFDWLSRDKSDNRCAVLDDYYKAFLSDQSGPLAKWFSETTRPIVNY